jgi:multidrug efflux pump subunit AcrA (membrane-fusion protein)
MKKRSQYFIILLLGVLTLSACHKQDKKGEKEREKVVTVKEKSDSVALSYTGKINPARVVTVTCPEDGVVSKMNFKYGQMVKKDQFLMALNSVKLESEFHETVSNFLKAKDRYLNGMINFNGAQELFKEKIISRQEYSNEKSQHENDELTYIDARFKLEKILENVPGFDKSIEKLNLQDIKHIEKIFATSLEDLRIIAPAEGIVLFPVQTRSEEGPGEIVVGSDIKKGQSLLSIGDMNGITVDFQVSEADINRVKPGLEVVISTSGTNPTTLQGLVKTVAVQAKNARVSSEAASFPATAHVDNIKPQQIEYLRVGMSAKVTVKIPGKSSIMVPISAIRADKGKRWVVVVDTAGKRSKKEVNTGQTSRTEVVINSGLKPGEKVVAREYMDFDSEASEDD